MKLEARIVVCSALVILSMCLSEHTSSWLGSGEPSQLCPARTCAQDNNATSCSWRCSELGKSPSLLYSSPQRSPSSRGLTAPSTSCPPLLSPGWDHCLSVELPLGTAYITDSNNPKSHYCDADTGHQKATKPYSQGQFFVGMPTEDESDQDNNPTHFCQSSSPPTAAAADDDEKTCYDAVHIPRLYAAADSLLQLDSAPVPSSCCCMLLLDQYITWANFAFRGVKDGQFAYASFQYSPLEDETGARIGLMSWVTDPGSYRPVHREVSTEDYVKIGLRSHMQATIIPLPQLESMVKGKLDTISEISIGFTFVVAVNQYCYKGDGPITCPITQSCIHGFSHQLNLVKSLVANQVFSWQTFNIDPNASGCIKTETFRNIYYNNSVDLDCLERLTSDFTRVDIVNNNLNAHVRGVIGYSLRNYSSVLPSPVHPKWWNHEACPKGK